MRNALIALFLAVFMSTATGGDAGGVFLPDLLPGNTIACVVPPDNSSQERNYSGSLFRHIAELPEMGPFIQSFEESRREFVNDIAVNGNVPPQMAHDLVHSGLGLALINVGMGRDGAPTVEFALALTLSSQPDRNTVFTAVMALLNRPEVVRTVLKSQGMDPNLPLKTLAQEETISGYPPILRIGPNLRVAVFGNMVLLYHGPGSEGIKKIFDAASDPNTALSRNPAFIAAYQGADANPGMSFTYINSPRLTSILDALNLGHITRITDTLGFSAVQAVGLAAGYQMEGVRHSLYLHTPGGPAAGMMSALLPMPQAQVGMEGYSQVIPAGADAFMSCRVDMAALMRELPYFIESIGALVRPGGITGVLANEQILGVSIPEILQTLGGDIVIRPHDDTLVLMFHNVDIQAFESIIARMEQNAGAGFNSLNVGGYIVRYFNRRASLAAPIAPAYFLTRSADGNRGILYMAPHPQAVVSLLQESVQARDPLSSTPDYQKTASGMGANYSLYYYNNNTDCYRRVYNFLLPVASLWSSSQRYPVDTGLLPTASSILPGFFGCAVGVRSLPDGLLVQSYSPVGFNALLVLLADKLVVSNPLIIGYAYARIEEWMSSIPAW